MSSSISRKSLFLLSACDAIVFPYQQSEESASGAVRLGLAAGRPVLTTPLPIFADLSEIVYQLPGTEAWEIAEGIISLLGRRTTARPRSCSANEIGCEPTAGPPRRLAYRISSMAASRKLTALSCVSPADPVGLDATV